MSVVKNLLFVLPLLVVLPACAQDTTTTKGQGAVIRTQAGDLPVRTEDRELNLRAYAELLRKDMKMQRAAIITEIMQFESAEAATFWPIFKQYDTDLTKIADGRVDIIEDYIKNYDNITDEKADALMSKVFALEAQRAELKKKYFDILKSAMTAKTAARFFQVENQLQYVIDLQIAASLPAVQ